MKHIFQVLISDPGQPPPAFTPLLEDHIASFRQTYPKAQYRLYDSAEIRAFIQDRFGARLLGTYDCIQPLAYKADFARYCLLYEHGGLYSDLSHRHINPIKTDGFELVVFRDLPRHPPWAISNGLIYSTPGRREFKHAIEQITRNADAKFYGVNPLDPTGPYLFGRILAQTADWDKIAFGTSHWRREFWPLKPHMVRVRKKMPDGFVVADKIKKSHANISDLIGSQGNSYNQMWEDRLIWGSPQDRSNTDLDPQQSIG